MVIEATETHILNVDGAPDLKVRNSAGSITINAGPAGQVTLEATKKIVGGIFGQPKDADLDKIAVDVTQEGNLVSISVHPGVAEALFGKSSLVDLVITAPAQTNADLQLNAGAITLSGAQGRARGRINAGAFEVSEAAMTGVDVAVNVGAFRYQGALAPDAVVNVEVNTGNAVFLLPPTASSNLDAQTTSGIVSLMGLSLADERTATLQWARGATQLDATGFLTVRVNTGNIDLIARD